jgi:hypothetical protein
MKLTMEQLADLLKEASNTHEVSVQDKWTDRDWYEVLTENLTVGHGNNWNKWDTARYALAWLLSD